MGATALAALLASCSPAVLPSATLPPASATATERPTPAATLVPTPTPQPTPRFTNEADPALAALFPGSVAGVPLVVAPLEEFALTPGDVGLAYGDLGLRFSALAIAYTEQPRLTLYAMATDGAPVRTAELEPYLAEAGRYVGVAGLQHEPWELTEVGGHSVWMRLEDDATAAGTRIYSWSSGDFVFLLIGADDGLNRALVAALPGEAPRVGPSAAPSGSDSPAPSPSGG